MQKKLFEQDNNIPKIVDSRNRLNELTGKEWVKETASVWYQRGLGRDHPHTVYERMHPAPFPYLMIQRLLLFFTKKGDLVLDPFCGVGSTLKACALNDRRGIGIELVEKWVELTKKRLATEANKGPEQIIIQGDSREVMKQFKDDFFDFIVTSPPYWGILNKPPDHRVKEERLKENLDTRYSIDPRDLANIPEYETFLAELKKVFAECYRTLKVGKYMVVVVADFRHKSQYVMYHADICKIMMEVGFTIKGLTIFVKNAKKLYPYGYPYEYVPNIHHEYIMIFKKEMKNDNKSIG
ncbi:MAG: DNA methyltransferase [Candidatus Bathyarchaeia archaeon]